MPPLDDDPSRRLVELIQAGIDVDANSERLHRLHYRRVRYFFQNKGFSDEDARDLTQEVFLRVFKGLDKFRGESRFDTWLFEIADHLYKNELRRRGAGRRKGWEVSLDTGGKSDDGEEGTPFEPPPSPPKALDDVLDKERAEKLSKAIQELPDQMRTCFLLRYGQGRKYKEIADIMGISIDTVKAHLHQAKKRLKLKLQEPSDD